ncbi:MAG: pentapeptide repeat-containing protein [Nitrososphaeraceae archaeon]|nr:pentapeptide repeat-containing protein [Nitrososphaeraceae archaeon]
MAIATMPTTTSKSTRNSRRFALLVVTSEYDDPYFQRLHSPGKDAKKLANVLKNPDIGDFEDVKIMPNKPYWEISEEIETFFSDRLREDLLLLYFSCHGIKDGDGLLYYAAKNTKIKQLKSTAIRSNSVNEFMETSNSRRQILVIDCCYSGAFLKEHTVKGDKEIHTNEYFQQGDGKVVLTACDAISYSFEEDKNPQEVNEPRSIFTWAIVDGLDTGKADLDKDGMISCDELFDYASEQVKERMPNQKPQKWVFKAHEKIIIAKNSRPLDLNELKNVLLNSKVELFNSLCEQNYYEHLDFHASNLSHKILNRVNLSKTDLTKADLSETKLSDANLNEVNLSGATLTQTDLRGAVLGEIDFSGAKLTDANFRNATFNGKINFDDATLNNVNFEGIVWDLKQVTFNRTEFKNLKGLSDDLQSLPPINKYVKELKSFYPVLEKEFNSYCIAQDRITTIREDINKLVRKIKDIYDDEKQQLSEIKEQDIKKYYIEFKNEVISTLSKTNEPTSDIFKSLKSFEKLIGEEQIIQNTLSEKKHFEYHEGKKNTMGIELSHPPIAINPPIAESVDITKADEFYKKGLELYTSGKYQEALECYEKALEINPKHLAAIRDKGSALARLGRYSEAMKFNPYVLPINLPDYYGLSFKEAMIATLRKWWFREYP